MKLELLKDLRTVGQHLITAEEYDAMASVETFCAIAFRVFSKTNPSKLRSEMVNVELQARLAPGAKVL